MELERTGSLERPATAPVADDVRLLRVYASEIEALKSYVAALYEHDEDFEAMKYIEEGVTSLLRNPELATAYFIDVAGTRVGYVILTRYHSVERGGLTIYIDELFVEPDKRRQGIGRHILSRIVEIAKASGARGLSAQAETWNTAAQEFFLKQGFSLNPYRHFERML
jgi:GNAT superfamily N-acetyltransferase